MVNIIVTTIAGKRKPCTTETAAARVSNNTAYTKALHG